MGHDFEDIFICSSSMQGRILYNVYVKQENNFLSATLAMSNEGYLLYVLHN
jgi:hypothetical protein